jgi:hypothetical protein
MPTPAHAYHQCCHANAIACQHQHLPPTNAVNTNTSADATNDAANVTPTTNVANTKTQGPNDKLVVVWAPGIFFIVHFIFFSTHKSFLFV